MCVLSCFRCVWFCVTLWTAARQAVRGILQARTLEWVAMPSRGLPNPRIKPVFLISPALAGGFFTTGAYFLKTILP